MEICNITFDCRDPYRMVTFGAEATGYQEEAGNPNAPDDPEGLLVAPDGRLNLPFIMVPEAKQIKNRVHLDVRPTEGTRDQEVEHLLGLGARLVDDRRKPDGSGWTVLSDPEGNEFCIERGTAERLPSSSRAETPEPLSAG